MRSPSKSQKKKVGKFKPGSKKKKGGIKGKSGQKMSSRAKKLRNIGRSRSKTKSRSKSKKSTKYGNSGVKTSPFSARKNDRHSKLKKFLKSSKSGKKRKLKIPKTGSKSSSRNRTSGRKKKSKTDAFGMPETRIPVFKTSESPAHRNGAIQGAPQNTANRSKSRR